MSQLAMIAEHNYGMDRELGIMLEAEEQRA